ncbi:hypothetical protein V1511DRAFT_496693 [Dipodascopsis uninucleata]
MLLSLLATIVSLLWLLHRATRLLQIPIPTLVSLLGIDIPASPHVCLDAVTSESITLHWSLPDRATSVAKHVIQMNGQNVGESEKRETTVTITGLHPNHVYGVRVLAVNSNHYSAAGQLIRLRTRRKSEDLVLTDIQPIPHEAVNDKEENKDDLQDVSDSVSRAQSNIHMQFKRGRRTGRNSSTGDRSSFTAATQPYTIESLAAELEQIRAEISETSVQHMHAEEEYQSTAAALQSELEVLREKRKQEDSARAQMRVESKSLEESKRTLEAQKSKIERSVKHKEEILDKITANFEKWEMEQRHADERRVEINSELEKLKKHLSDGQKKHNSALKRSHQEIAELEDDIRGLIAKVKKAEMEKDPHTGDKDQNAFAKLLHAEDSEDLHLENTWQEVQKSLELRYVNVFEQYRDAEDKFRKAQATLAEVTMKSARLPATAFGNNSGLLHTTEMAKVPKRRGRSRNKMRQQVSAPLTSYPLHDSRFSDANIFNPTHFSPGSLSHLGKQQSNSSLHPMPFSLNTSSMSSLYSDPITDGIDPTDDVVGPTSPSVDMLLPSNLFVTDDMSSDEEEHPRRRTTTGGSELSLDSSPIFSNLQPSSLSISSPSPPPSTPPSSVSTRGQKPFSSLFTFSSSAPGFGRSLFSNIENNSDDRVTEGSLAAGSRQNLGPIGALDDNPDVTGTDSIATKRVPGRRLMFSGVNAISNIGRKKDSMESTAPSISGASSRSSEVVTDDDEFLVLPGEAQRPLGKNKLANLFSFSRPRTTSSSSSSAQTTSPVLTTLPNPPSPFKNPFSNTLNSSIPLFGAFKPSDSRVQREAGTDLHAQSPPAPMSSTIESPAQAPIGTRRGSYGSWSSVVDVKRRRLKLPWDVKDRGRSNGATAIDYLDEREEHDFADQGDAKSIGSIKRSESRSSSSEGCSLDSEGSLDVDRIGKQFDANFDPLGPSKLLFNQDLDSTTSSSINSMPSSSQATN